MKDDKTQIVALLKQAFEKLIMEITLKYFSTKLAIK